MKYLHPIAAAIFYLILSSLSVQGQEIYWKITDRSSIVWDVAQEERLPHSDNIEMAGNNVATIVYYSVDENRMLQVERDVIFPQLRTYNKSNEPWWRQYRAYFRHTFTDSSLPSVFLDTIKVEPGPIDFIEIEGKLTFHHEAVNNIATVRTIYPSMTDRFIVEKWELINQGSENVILKIGNAKYEREEVGYKGIYTLKAWSASDESITLKPGESYVFPIYFAAALNEESVKGFSFETAESQRNAFIREMKDNLILNTSDQTINTLFYFSKIRAAENIFTSKLGKIHSPGGGNYYVGVWANDQAEYSGPFFPFLGYEDGITAAFNAYKVFLNNIPEDYQAISSSFEIEGELLCCNRDRGDAAMIAYGGSQFALLTGDREMANEIWPLIEWSLEYCHRRKNENGVIESDTDEMESRISTGNANLATSSLYLGGLKFGSYLASELGYKKLAKLYRSRQKELESAIESHFGYNLEGLGTYRYYDGNTHLRHWICLPLVMGIETRSDATTTALLTKLWTENGVLVELNPDSDDADVFWDRGTLYALRGTFKSGAVDLSYDKLRKFSTKRLVGDHVPYVIEAYPENNMRHLSAESALYCRLIIEGLMGFEQTSFRSFTITPQLPAELDFLTLNKMHFGDAEIDIQIRRSDEELMITLSNKGKEILSRKVQMGETVSVSF